MADKNKVEVLRGLYWDDVHITPFYGTLFSGITVDKKMQYIWDQTRLNYSSIGIKLG